MSTSSPLNEKSYLCTEHGEEFTVMASSLEEAQQKAAVYGGSELGAKE